MKLFCYILCCFLSLLLGCRSQRTTAVSGVVVRHFEGVGELRSIAARDIASLVETVTITARVDSAGALRVVGVDTVKTRTKVTDMTAVADTSRVVADELRVEGQHEEERNEQAPTPPNVPGFARWVGVAFAVVGWLLLSGMVILLTIILLKTWKSGH